MSNDERVEELKKRIDIELSYSKTLPNKKAAKPNVKRLKELAKEIRKTVEDYTIEAATYTDPSYRPK